MAMHADWVSAGEFDSQVAPLDMHGPKSLARAESTVSQVAPQDMHGPKSLRRSFVSNDSAEAVDVLEFASAELLRQGDYGLVNKVTDMQTGQSRVLKTVVRPDGWNDQRLKMEAEILESLDHPHILRIFAWYEDGDSINIVMEHCEGGELLNAVQEGWRRGQTLPEAWAAIAMRQCFQALVYIHDKGIVHKDLTGHKILLLHNTTDKAGNIFGRQPHVTICDLDVAEICSLGIFGMRGKQVAGTPTTMAPEVWMGFCAPRSDVWSMGCVMFELFTNHQPFQLPIGSAEDEQKQKRLWLKLHEKGPNWDLLRATPEAVQFNQRLLVFKESARPTAVEVLQHPWLSLSVSDCLTPAEVESLCRSVATWRERTPMQQAMCLKMAASCACISMFSRFFSIFDKDNSGVLDRSEVVAAMMSLGMKRALAKKTAQSLDINDDNSCEYVEFVAACLASLEEKYNELLRHEFRILDPARRGYVTPEAMQVLISQLTPLASSHGLTLQELDTDGDGCISFVEFCEYFGLAGQIYSEEMLYEKVNFEDASPLPKKQHIRILGVSPRNSSSTASLVEEEEAKPDTTCKQVRHESTLLEEDIGKEEVKPERKIKDLRQAGMLVKEDSSIYQRHGPKSCSRGPKKGSKEAAANEEAAAAVAGAQAALSERDRCRGELQRVGRDEEKASDGSNRSLTRDMPEGELLRVGHDEEKAKSDCENRSLTKDMPESRTLPCEQTTDARGVRSSEVEATFALKVHSASAGKPTPNFDATEQVEIQEHIHGDPLFEPMSHRTRTGGCMCLSELLPSTISTKCMRTASTSPARACTILRVSL